MSFYRRTARGFHLFKVLSREFESTGRRFDPRFVEPVAGLSIGHWLSQENRTANQREKQVENRRGVNDLVGTVS